MVVDNLEFVANGLREDGRTIAASIVEAAIDEIKYLRIQLEEAKKLEAVEG
jgi:hypothetical protein